MCVCCTKIIAITSFCNYVCIAPSQPQKVRPKRTTHCTSRGSPCDLPKLPWIFQSISISAQLRKSPRLHLGHLGHLLPPWSILEKLTVLCKGQGNILLHEISSLILQLDTNPPPWCKRLGRIRPKSPPYPLSEPLCKA